MNVVIINKSGCEHTVHSEEQLNLFLEAGWEIKPEKPIEVEKPKNTRVKTKVKE